ncbi:MAG: DNA (cytosine-5-)-methyltransferase [Candidatus Nanoarchaeia archaeon]|jgi:DNA (cytosine-5)-methyltransferase 1
MEQLKTFIDLFAGIGGFRIVMESSGLNCVFSSEWDKYSQLTYNSNFQETPEGDITKINEKDIPQHDILCAGFPCQAFSISGKQKGFEDTRGTLFFDICRIAKEKKPKVLFLENVKNLKRHNKGETFKKIVQSLENLNYNVFPEILKASYYGAPTARERIYFVCFRKDLGITNFEFPKPTNEKIYLKDKLEHNKDLSDYEIKRGTIASTKTIANRQNKRRRTGRKNL